MNSTRTPSAGRAHRLLALGLAAALVAGCTAWPGPAQSQSRAPDSDTMPGDDAGLVPPDVLKIPQFPVPPHANVVLADTVIVGDDEDWSGQVFLTAPYTVIQVTQFYRAEMPKNGWLETAIVRSRRTSLSYTRGNRVASLRLSSSRDDGKSTDIDLVVSPIQTAASTGGSHRPGGGGSGSAGGIPGYGTGGIGSAPLPPPANSRPRP